MTQSLDGARSRSNRFDDDSPEKTQKKKRRTLSGERNGIDVRSYGGQSSVFKTISVLRLAGRPLAAAST